VDCHCTLSAGLLTRVYPCPHSPLGLVLADEAVPGTGAKLPESTCPLAIEHSLFSLNHPGVPLGAPSLLGWCLQVKQFQELRAKLPESTSLLVMKNSLLEKATRGDAL